MNEEEIDHTWNIKALQRLFSLRESPSQGQWFFKEAVSIVNSH
jgi:hypothetical protein